MDKSTIRKQYDIIYLDPPWAYNSRAHHKGKFRGGACGHYPLLSNKELAKIDLSSIAKKDSVMFLWGTFPMLKDQIALMESWGWTYKTMAFVWLKFNKNENSIFMGPGHYTRANMEPVLFGTRGKCLIPEDRSVKQPVVARRMGHSKKPEEIRMRIECMYPNADRIELFAIRQVEGWDCYGMALDGQDIRSYIRMRDNTP